MNNLSGVSKATARPWKIEEHSSGLGVRVYHKSRLFGQDMQFIGEQGQANAELIVKAVNSHEALVESCKEAINDFESAYGEVHKMTINKMKEALKQAGEV